MVIIKKKTRQISEFGDFQTPPDLAREATEVLRRSGFEPELVIEPTCGKGAFLLAALEAFPNASKILGVDINATHLRDAQNAVLGVNKNSMKVSLIEGDFFKINWTKVLTSSAKPLLIIGNPPWVTNSNLGSLASENLPIKSNLHNHKGIEAITGKSNFDISEWMLLQYIDWLDTRGGTIAVLCKTAVARKILSFVWRKRLSIESARIYKIDSLLHFSAAVDACFFILNLDTLGTSTECLVFESLSDEKPSHCLGYHRGYIINNTKIFKRHENLLGVEQNYVWRSGVKHDRSKIMELSPKSGLYENGLGELIDIEDTYVYPLLKSSDVGNGRLTYRNAMIVTQRFVGDDTSLIAKNAPKTWSYLFRHSEAFAQRGSAIYKRQPPFAIFGVGEYSFAPWKVAISGLYKNLTFRQVGNINGKPVVFDDTVNFLACSSEQEAKFLLEILSSEAAQEFYKSILHWDEKRPITIEILRRLSLRNLASDLGRKSEYEYFAVRRGPPLLALLS